MKALFTFILLSITQILSAQNTDYPDYRSKKEIFSRIIEKDIRSDIASFSMGGIDESVGKLPLKSLPITAFGSDFISFAGDNIQVKITSAPFDKSKHKLGFYEENYLVKINNKPYYGDQGKVPKTTVNNVTIIIDKDTVAIPATAYNDIHNPIFSFFERGVQKSQDKVFISSNGQRVYIYLLKQGDASSYEVTWVIQDKKYLRRVVDFGFLR